MIKRIIKKSVLERFVLNKSIDISAGAFIMAMGIFLLGAIKQFSFIDDHLGFIFTCMIMFVWLFMLLSFFRSLFISEYIQNLIQFPIKSFGAGTWIAASSVMGTLILDRFPSFLPFVKVLLFFYLILWGLFIVFCIKQLRVIILRGYIKDTHGILLLSTVSTQSIVCLILNIYKTNIEPVLVIALIMLGMIFYLFSFILLIIRFSSKFFNIHEWKNTDCIIHGAVSITGLSMTLSGEFTFSSLINVWYLAFSLFVTVEIIEVIRVIKRMKEYGWRRGVFTYHISQWSRNFTFGMFYFFTMKLVDQYASSGHSLVFQTHFLQVLGWLVFALLIIQSSIFLAAKKEEVQRRHFTQVKNI
jgi:hypothetical protein